MLSCFAYFCIFFCIFWHTYAIEVLMGQMHVFAYFCIFKHICFAYFCIFMLMHILAYQDIDLAYYAYFRNAYLCIVSFAYFYIFCAYICTYLSLTSMIFGYFQVAYLCMLSCFWGDQVSCYFWSTVLPSARLEGQKGSRLCRVQKRLSYALQRRTGSPDCPCPGPSRRTSAQCSTWTLCISGVNWVDARSRPSAAPLASQERVCWMTQVGPKAPGPWPRPASPCQRLRFWRAAAASTVPLRWRTRLARSSKARPRGFAAMATGEAWGAQSPGRTVSGKTWRCGESHSWLAALALHPAASIAIRHW